MSDEHSSIDSVHTWRHVHIEREGLGKLAVRRQVKRSCAFINRKRFL